MIDVVKNSIKSTLYDRITSPLFGSFAISWSVWNYKLIVVLLSSMKAPEKLTYIEKYIYTDPATIWYQGMSYPLMTSVAFIIFYPFPAKIIYEYWQLQQKSLKTIKQKIEDETPLTQEESRKLRRDIINIVIEHDKEISKRNHEIEKLNTELEEIKINNAESTKTIEMSEKEIEALKVKLSDLGEPKSLDEFYSEEGVKPVDSDDLHPIQVQMLRQVGESQKGISKENLLIKYAEMKVKAQYYLDDLVIKGFLKEVGDGADSGYLIVHGGREYLVKNHLL